MLLDLMLPKLSGPEVLAALKRDPGTSGLRSVLDGVAAYDLFPRAVLGPVTS